MLTQTSRWWCYSLFRNHLVAWWLSQFGLLLVIKSQICGCDVVIFSSLLWCRWWALMSAESMFWCFWTKKILAFLFPLMLKWSKQSYRVVRSSRLLFLLLICLDLDILDIFKISQLTSSWEKKRLIMSHHPAIQPAIHPLFHPLIHPNCLLLPVKVLELIPALTGWEYTNQSHSPLIPISEPRTFLLWSNVTYDYTAIFTGSGEKKGKKMLEKPEKSLA